MEKTRILLSIVALSLASCRPKNSIMGTLTKISNNYSYQVVDADKLMAKAAYIGLQ